MKVVFAMYVSYDIDNDRGSIFDVGVFCDIGNNGGGISDVYIKLFFLGHCCNYRNIAQIGL